MSTIQQSATLVLLALAAIVVVLGYRRLAAEIRYRRVRGLLATAPSGITFSPDLVSGLPEPAQRYLLHAIAPGTPLARSVRLRQNGKMKAGPEAEYSKLEAEERLTPLRGFVWRAKVHLGRVPVVVWDHYLEGEGSVLITLLGVLPIQVLKGPETARSARHRLALESLWVPSVLIPEASALSPTVRWAAAETDTARATLTIDGEDIEITFVIDSIGRLVEATMARYGDVGDEPWELLPYGFAVEDERTFGGYTVPSLLRGGWWFGSDRYDRDVASEFEVVEATYE